MAGDTSGVQTADPPDDRPRGRAVRMLLPLLIAAALFQSADDLRGMGTSVVLPSPPGRSRSAGAVSAAAGWRWALLSPDAG